MVYLHRLNNVISNNIENNMSNIQKLPDSNAGQVTPGMEDLHYKAYLNRRTFSDEYPPLTKEQWKMQFRMLKSQLLREG